MIDRHPFANFVDAHLHFVDFTLQGVCDSWFPFQLEPSVQLDVVCIVMAHQCFSIIFLKGSVYREKRSGPKTDPCGTPVFKGVLAEAASPITTC